MHIRILQHVCATVNVMDGRATLTGDIDIGFSMRIIFWVLLESLYRSHRFQVRAALIWTLTCFCLVWSGVKWGPLLGWYIVGIF